MKLGGIRPEEEAGIIVVRAPEVRERLAGPAHEESSFPAEMFGNDKGLLHSLCFPGREAVNYLRQSHGASNSPAHSPAPWVRAYSSSAT